jgi:hypothetical protein
VRDPVGASVPSGFYDSDPGNGSDRWGVRKEECEGGEFLTRSGADSGNISWPGRGVHRQDRRIWMSMTTLDLSHVHPVFVQGRQGQVADLKDVAMKSNSTNSPLS